MRTHFRLIATTVSVLLAGCAPTDEPVPPQAADGPAWFRESAVASGIDFTHVSGHDGRYLMPECIVGGGALFDMDGDDDLDAYLVQSGPLSGDGAAPGNRLYRNHGDGTFEDVTEGSGADDRGYGSGVTTGDFDNDGDLDLYVTNVGPNTLLRNEGGGRFVDVTEASGTGHAGFGSSAAFLDYDTDGDLDLFVANYLNWSERTEIDCYNNMGSIDYCSPTNYNAPAQDVLYRNNGDGTFDDVSKTSGIGSGSATGLGVVCGDFNGDGLVDVFVANDGMRDHLWANRGDGSFEDTALVTGCGYDQDGQAKAGMGVTAADIDDDGDLDLLVCNLNAQTDSFFLNNDGVFFSDATSVAGLGSVGQRFTRFGMAWIDFDLDGWLDLLQVNGRVMRQSTSYADDPYAEPNLLYRGHPGPRFEEITPAGGTADPLVATSRAAAFGDVDSDGDIDVLVVNRDGPAHLLVNTAPRSGHWISLRVVDAHGRDALGATVSLTAGTRQRSSDVRTGYSYLAANDPRVHFGLGEIDRVRSVTVRWPDGSQESFGDLEANRRHLLRRGDGSPESVGPGG